MLVLLELKVYFSMLSKYLIKETPTSQQEVFGRVMGNTVEGLVKSLLCMATQDTTLYQANQNENKKELKTKTEPCETPKLIKHVAEY